MTNWDNLVEPARDALEALIRKGDEMADRIEELEANLANMAGLWAKSDSEKQLLLGRIDELEAKLAKAVAFMNHVADGQSKDYTNNCDLARSTLAKLKGPSVK